MTISRFAWHISVFLLSVLFLTTSAVVADSTSICQGSLTQTGLPADGRVYFRSRNQFTPDALAILSDERLKTEVRDLNYGISDIVKLRPVRFKWKARPEDGDHLGVIAQEIQKTIPEVVKYEKIDPEKRLSVDYLSLIPVLIHGLQEQQKQIISQQSLAAAQQTQLEIIQAENQSLLARVDDLETAIIDVLTAIDPR